MLPRADLRGKKCVCVCVCRVSGGFKRQKVVVIPELAGKKCFLFYQRPFEGPHVFFALIDMPGL